MHGACRGMPIQGWQDHAERATEYRCGAAIVAC
jgi:hypothetical protein